jgi:threonine/homoserine/homoserine lactone efflux protein
MTDPNQRSGQDGWLASFLKELVSMPRRHIVVFVVSAILLILLEVELTEGWNLVHILELLGVLVFVYLLWTAWQTRQSRHSRHVPRRDHAGDWRRMMTLQNALFLYSRTVTLTVTRTVKWFASFSLRQQSVAEASLPEQGVGWVLGLTLPAWTNWGRAPNQ